MDIKTGFFLQDGNAVNVILGFVPDHLELNIGTDASDDGITIKWSRAMYEAGLTDKYGQQIAADGTVTGLETAAKGVKPFDSSGDYVNVVSPIPGVGKKPTVVQTWATGITPTARSATAIGTILRPTSKNGRVYECTTASGAIAGAEPTWPTALGATVTDADSNVWTCINEEVVRGGGKGFTLGATPNTDGDYCSFVAIKSDKDRYLGDAADGDLSLV